MKHVRLATKDEVESLRATSNYTAETIVYAMDQNAEPDFAVVKRVVELDPVYFSKHTNDIQKARFIWALEERMAGGGVEQYFFDIPADDQRYQAVVKNWGAEQVSIKPVLKFQKVLR